MKHLHHTVVVWVSIVAVFLAGAFLFISCRMMVMQVGQISDGIPGKPPTVTGEDYAITKVDEDTSLYTNFKYGFSFEYPSAWLLSINGLNGEGIYSFVIHPIGIPSDGINLYLAEKNDLIDSEQWPRIVNSYQEVIDGKSNSKVFQMEKFGNYQFAKMAVAGFGEGILEESDYASVGYHIILSDISFSANINTSFDKKVTIRDVLSGKAVNEHINKLTETVKSLRFNQID